MIKLIKKIFGLTDKSSQRLPLDRTLTDKGIPKCFCTQMLTDDAYVSEYDYKWRQK
jgi:hypothetical protein